MSTIPVEDVEELLFYEDIRRTDYNYDVVSACMHPVIILKLKEEAKLRRSFSLFTSLGYSSPAEFYNPAYDTPGEQSGGTPDLRTTVYWNPSLRIDASGHASLEFYATDSTRDYVVEIEGITTEGKVCRFKDACK